MPNNGAAGYRMTGAAAGMRSAAEVQGGNQSLAPGDRGKSKLSSLSVEGEGG